jgi:CheY-like chemotaxis protein
MTMTKTVLIVEDNELNMKLFNDLLEAYGYLTIKTMSGQDAMSLARASSAARCRTRLGSDCAVCLPSQSLRARSKRDSGRSSSSSPMAQRNAACTHGGRPLGEPSRAVAHRYAVHSTSVARVATHALRPALLSAASQAQGA